MITVTEKTENRCSFDLSYIADPRRLIFFDIETTGLRASSSSLYLIGVLLYDGGGFLLHQYFSEGMLDERQLLESFASHLEKIRKAYGKPVLVSYNGDTFDLPYLKETFREYGLRFDWDSVLSFDIYRLLRPVKRLTGLSDLKLPSVEGLLGTGREDTCSGGELIGVYEEYIRLSGIPAGGCEDNELNEALRKKCLSALLLHNACDVKALPEVASVISYRMLYDREFDLASAQIREMPGKASVLDLSFRLRSPLPKGFFYEDENYVISVSEEDAGLFELTARLTRGELRVYYQDYKNYYYLPAEDVAVHKSVGGFVDRKNRRQATASTCYGKREGLFLPEPVPVFAPVFYKSYKGTKYGELTEDSLKETEKLTEYAAEIIKMLCSSKSASS